MTSENEKQKRFPELYNSSQSCSSSDSEEEMPLESSGSDDVSIENSTSEHEVEESSSGSIPSILPTKAYAIAKVYSNSANSKNFEAQIVSGPDEDNDYEVRFLRRSTKVKNAFIFPEVEDLASISYNDIVCVLSDSLPVAQTARLSNIFRFSENVMLFDV